jgi:NTP pyrophosphatase (non-canonical NTP hydrolase)
MASLNECRDQIQRLCDDKGWSKSSIEQVWLYLSEEFGELASAIRRNTNQYCDNKKIKIEDEIGDVFSYLFQISGMLKIDLETVWEKNMVKSQKKNYKSKSTFQNGWTMNNK